MCTKIAKLWLGLKMNRTLTKYINSFPGIWILNDFKRHKNMFLLYTPKTPSYIISLMVMMCDTTRRVGIFDLFQRDEPGTIKHVNITSVS